MKTVKIMLALLGIAACLTLTACGASDGAKAALTCREIADQVQAACGFGELTDVPESYLEKHLFVDAADLTEWVMRRDTDGASPEMIVILQVKEGASREEVKKALTEYREEQIASYRDYQPEQVYKLENSRVLENGNRLALIVAPDAAKAVSALGGGWK